MSAIDLDRKSTVYDQADPALVSQYVNEHIGSHRIAVPDRCRLKAVLRHRKLSELDLCQIFYGDRVQVTSPALENIYHLQIVLNGHCQWTFGGHTEMLIPGDLLLINPDQDIDLVYSKDCGKFILKLPRKMVRQAAVDNHFIVTGSELHFNGSRYRLQKIPELLDLLRLILSESGSSSASEQVKTHYAHALCAKLLDQFPTNTATDGTLGDTNHFDRLVECIDAHLNSQLGVNTLAKWAHMSPRSIYDLFNRRVGVSPMQFIRERKLACVRQKLIDSDRQPSTITSIAFEYGFSHLGRFASQYRRQYGELPSETLSRRH